MAPLRILIASTPVGPLGSGIGGGVELTLHSLVYGLSGRSHAVEVVAPAGSLHVGSRVHQIEGVLQPSSQLADRTAPIQLPAGSVLAAMWERIADLQHDYDVIVNLSYDWLPLYLTRFFDVPVVHLVSMASLNDVMDTAVRDVGRRFPDRLAAHTRAQASTFGGQHSSVPFRIVGNGVVVDRYDFRARAEVGPAYLGAVGRISPEKGFEDVAALSQRSGWPVKVWGMMQDPEYWERLSGAFPGAQLEYCGFVATDELQAAIGGCAAVIMTPKWVEAFGNVAIEAMATGVPVITYDRGGPAEIVMDGVTGFVVPADDIGALVAAVGQIATIDRGACRSRVEQRYSTEALAERIESWLHEVVATASARDGRTARPAV